MRAYKGTISFDGVSGPGVIVDFEKSWRLLFWTKLWAGASQWDLFNAPDEDELYDLARDPHELNNRIDDPTYDEIATEGRRRLLQWIQDSDDPIQFAARGMLG